MINKSSQDRIQSKHFLCTLRQSAVGPTHCDEAEDCPLAMCHLGLPVLDMSVGCCFKILSKICWRKYCHSSSGFITVQSRASFLSDCYSLFHIQRLCLSGYPCQLDDLIASPTRWHGFVQTWSVITDLCKADSVSFLFATTHLHWLGGEW